MLDLYLMRHGECEANKTPHLVGGRSAHSPLTPKGKIESRILAKRLVKEEIKFDELYSSPDIRVIQEAEIVCEVIGIPIEDVIVCDELRELSLGDWEGKPKVEVYTPDVMKEIQKKNWRYKPPTGESQEEVAERMYKWVEERLLSRYQEELRVGIFGHGLAFKCLLHRIIGFFPEMIYKLVLDNASITRLKYNEKGWHPICINDTGHLVGLEKELSQS